MTFRRQPRLDDFPALGFIPCPGDQESMDSVAQTFSDTAEVLNEVLAVLTGADEGEWRGETARAFREMLEDDFQPKVDAAYQSFSDARRAISDWLVDMEDFQQRAATLEDEAATARDQVQTAQAAVTGLPPASETSGSEEQEPEDGGESPEEERERLESDLTTAEGALEDVRGRARTLQDEYNEAGRDIADRLRDAMDLAPNEPGWLSSAIDGFSGWMDSIGDLIDDFGSSIIDVLTELAPILSKIGEIAGLLSFVAGLMAFIPIPGFQALAGVSLALGAISLGATYFAAVGETGSFTTALTDPDVIMGAASMAMGLGVARLTTSMRGMGSVDEGPMGAVLPSATNLLGQSDDVMRFALVSNTWTAYSFANDLTGSVETLWNIGDGWHTDNSPVATD
jgi:hypothetical protein